MNSDLRAWTANTLTLEPSHQYLLLKQESFQGHLPLGFPLLMTYEVYITMPSIEITAKTLALWTPLKRVQRHVLSSSGLRLDLKSEPFLSVKESGHSKAQRVQGQVGGV